MKLLTTAVPLQDAITKLDAKSVVASTLRTADWAQVRLALRDRAFFSAAVEDAQFLETAKSKLLMAVALQKEQVVNPQGDVASAYVDRSSFIGDMRKRALDAGLSDGSGGLTDLASRTRLKLIYDIQTQHVTNYTRRKTDMQPAILDAYPAYELVRMEERKDKRDWIGIWTGRVPKSNGEVVARPGRLVAGDRMIALKTDPIWVAISVFGTPWPPFDFGSGMGLDDVSRRDAEDFGLLQPGEEIQPVDADFNEALLASTQDIGPDLLQSLVDLFGDRVSVEGDTISWTGGRNA
jgi:hypothetical protein